jgi:hypothetical protein
MFTPPFRLMMVLILLGLTGLMVWANAWLAAVMVGLCALVCIANIIKEIMDVPVSSETDQRTR